MWASMLTDFLAKVTGKANLKFDDVRQFPHPRDHFLVLRALRLSCLTADYAALWEELFDPTWRQDAWTREIPSLPIGEVTQEWAMATPLRRDAERRQVPKEVLKDVERLGERADLGSSGIPPS